MGGILTLADKFERAVRNGTGFNITRDEMVAMAEEGVLDAIFAAKLKRLKQYVLARSAPQSPATAGLTSGGMLPAPSLSGSSSERQDAAKDYIRAHNLGR